MGLGKIVSSPCYRRIDILYTKPKEYPFAMLYFTGSKDFNERMRGNALKLGFSMNEYSLKDKETKALVDVDFHTEKAIFDFLQAQVKEQAKPDDMYVSLEYIKPEERN